MADARRPCQPEPDAHKYAQQPTVPERSPRSQRQPFSERRPHPEPVSHPQHDRTRRRLSVHQPLTQKGLPTEDDLAASGQDWNVQDSFDGPGEAPSLCLAQDLTTLAGLQQVFRRDYTLDGEGYGTALVFDFDVADAAESVVGTLVKDATSCEAPLTKAGFLADAPIGPTDAEIPRASGARRST